MHPRKLFRDTEDCFCLRYFCTSWPGLDAGMLVLALCVRLLACLRSEGGAPRNTRSTFRKRRGELGRLHRIPEICFVIPRIVFACAIFALPGLAWMRVCVCFRSVCGFWPGSEARRAPPSSGAPKHATKTSRDTEACFCLRYFCMSWPGLGAGMFALALEYRKASGTRG